LPQKNNKKIAADRDVMAVFIVLNYLFVKILIYRSVFGKLLSKERSFASNRHHP
jgi:hypothetical protein